MEKYIKPERLWLKAHPELNEYWVQDRVAEDPSILGLGDLELRQKERKQPRAGRLDLLLQDPDNRRYEVEIQLGGTDETHIIRTIEYWDVERKRYPQYDHCAVLIAEDVTSRFLNVISLFNGAIPLIAIQMQALRVGGQLTLVFTRVVDELTRGLVDEDEEAEASPADRSYWERRASKQTVGLADDMLVIAREIDPTLSLKYNKFYMGMEKDGLAFNFVRLKPKKEHLRVELRLPETDDITEKIEKAGLDSLDYNKRFGWYKVRLAQQDVTLRRDILRELLQLAYEKKVGG
jgi:hypothetical protein